jgi:hypothetical protein
LCHIRSNVSRFARFAAGGVVPREAGFSGLGGYGKPTETNQLDH